MPVSQYGFRNDFKIKDIDILMTAVPTARIVHLHVPKTAGTAFRSAFEKASGGKLRICPHFTEKKFSTIDCGQFDFFSGHFGFKTASELGGQIITVVRRPADRFVSLYYFWRQLYEKGIDRSNRTTLASKYPLSEFVKIRDEPSLLEAFYNTMTWQIAHGSSLAQRREVRMAGKTDDDVIQLAIANIATFSLVGLQEQLSLFAEAMAHKFSVALNIRKVNVTARDHPAADDIGTATIRAIRDWTFMDEQLYAHVDELVSKSASEQKSA